MITLYLTLAEHERAAYLRNDAAALALLHSAEEHAEDYVSPEHEAMIDDRNRLRDALQTCVDRMEETDTALTLFEPEIDIATGEPSCFELSDTFTDAIHDAETALERCDEQIDDTLATKLAQMTTERDALSANLKAATRDLFNSRDLVNAIRFVVHSYTTRPGSKPAKTPPKWAAYLIATLNRLEKP
jgi:hypothetical protein